MSHTYRVRRLEVDGSSIGQTWKSFTYPSGERIIAVLGTENGDDGLVDFITVLTEVEG